MGGWAPRTVGTLRVRAACNVNRVSQTESGWSGWGGPALSKQQRRPSVDPTVTNSHCIPGTSKSVFQIHVLWNLDVEFWEKHIYAITNNCNIIYL